MNVARVGVADVHGREDSMTAMMAAAGSAVRGMRFKRLIAAVSLVATYLFSGVHHLEHLVV